MQAALRPLPRIPPPHLTLSYPADIRSYRPLPTPPPQSADSIYTSSRESLCLRTPPTRTTSLFDTNSPTCTTRSSSSSLSSFSSPSSELLINSRPRLRIAVTAPNLRKRNSLDSLTVRSPALCDPGQVLSPIVDRRNDKPTIDSSRSTRVPCTSAQPNRVSAADSLISPLVFNTPAAATQAELNTPEPRGDRPAPFSCIPEPTRSVSGLIVDLQPPRSRLTPVLPDRIGTVHPVTPINLATDGISTFESDDEVEGLTPCTNDRESRASKGRSWIPFPKIAKVSMKPHLFRPRTRDVQIVGVKRTTKITPPLNQTWYKERDGRRWVERDLGDVLTELRKLR